MMNIGRMKHSHNFILILLSFQFTMETVKISLHSSSSRAHFHVLFYQYEAVLKEVIKITGVIFVDFFPIYIY